MGRIDLSRWKGSVAIEGVLLGLIALGVAYAIKSLDPGRWLGDPVPLALAPAGIMRSLREGFAYFDFRSPLLHITFAIAIGGGAAWLTARRSGTSHEARGTARVAAGLNMIVAAIGEIDAVIVGFYYALAAFVSLSISAYAADRITRWILRRRATLIRKAQEHE